MAKYILFIDQCFEINLHFLSLIEKDQDYLSFYYIVQNMCTSGETNTL